MTDFKQTFYRMIALVQVWIIVIFAWLQSNQPAEDICTYAVILTVMMVI